MEASRARVFPTIGVVFILQSFTTASFSLFFNMLQVKDFQSKKTSPIPRIVRKNLPFDGFGEGSEGKKHECRVVYARDVARARVVDKNGELCCAAQR